MKNYHSNSTLWLPFFRVTIAIFSIIHILSFSRDYSLFFSGNSFIQADIMDANLRGVAINLYDIHQVLVHSFPSLDYFIFSKLAIGLYVFALFFLAIGLFTRMSAIIALCLQIILLDSIHSFKYGADYFNTILLFYAVWAPLGKYLSMDNYLGFSVRERIEPILQRLFPANLILRTMQIHLCIVYGFSGIEKMTGPNWQSGESIWRALHNYSGLINFDIFNQFLGTSFFWALAWATMLVEALYPMMINLKFTRKAWLVLTIGMHLSIVLILGLFHFGAIMIIFNLVTYYFPFVKDTVPYKSKSAQQSPTIILNATS